MSDINTVVAITFIQTQMNALRKVRPTFSCAVDGEWNDILIDNLNIMIRELFDGCVPEEGITPVDGTPVQMLKNWYSRMESSLGSFSRLSVLECSDPTGDWTIKDQHCFEHIFMLWRDRVMGMEESYYDYGQQDLPENVIPLRKLTMKDEYLFSTTHPVSKMKQKVDSTDETLIVEITPDNCKEPQYDNPNMNYILRKITGINDPEHSIGGFLPGNNVSLFASTKGGLPYDGIIVDYNRYDNNNGKIGFCLCNVTSRSLDGIATFKGLVDIVAGRLKHNRFEFMKIELGMFGNPNHTINTRNLLIEMGFTSSVDNDLDYLTDLFKEVLTLKL